MLEDEIIPFIPNYLYHYTNVDTLALILKGRNIKLGRLDKMDDIQEGKAGDIEKVGKFCYVSSWTGSSDDIIPMWDRYTCIEKGVKIKLRSDFYKKYKVTEEVAKKFNLENSFIGKSTIIDYNQLNEEYTSNQWKNKDPWVQVCYVESNQLDKLEPNVCYNSNTIDLKNKGIYKSKVWAYQNEYRVKIDIFPRKINFDEVSNYKQKLEKFYIEIQDQAFENMEITLSPLMSKGYRVLAENIVNTNNPKAKIKDSDLRNKIR